MRVCHLSSLHPADDIRIVLKECKSLSSQYDVTFISLPPRYNTVDGVRHVRFPHIRSRLLRFVVSPLLMFLWALWQHASVYHIHAPELIAVGPWLRFCTGAKVIFDSHEDHVKHVRDRSYFHPALRWGISKYYHILSRLCMPMYHRVITVSDDIAKELSEYSKRVTVISNYPVIERDIRPNPAFDEAAFAYVGGMTPIRGIETMIRSFEHIDAKLHLAGTFDPPGYREPMTRLPGWDKAMEHGWVSREEVNRILEHVMAGILLYAPVPNYVSAMPNKLFEYMASGIPVVCSHFPVWKQIIEETGGGMCVDPEDPEAIAQALRWMLTHPEEARRMGERGRQLVLSTYNWDKEAERLVQLYQQLMDES